MTNGNNKSYHNAQIVVYERAVQTLESAFFNYERGRFDKADILCRGYLENNPGDPSAYLLLGKTAESLGVFYAAKEYYATAAALDSRLEEAQIRLERINVYETTIEAENSMNDNRVQSAKRNRYLLIKAWGFGFWSDIEHVMGQLLLAEITGRIPVVHWGKNSLFSSDDSANAFELYFEPVSGHDIHAVTGHSLSYYPPKWNSHNILEDDNNKWQGRYSRMTGLSLIGRHEDVLVSDYYTPLNSLVPWIPKEHELYGMAAEELYRKLFEKYMVLKPGLADEIERFWRREMAGKKWLGIHVRGTDKEFEVKNLVQLNKDYFDHIDRLMASDPDLYLFLLTDSADVLSQYQERYGNRIAFTDCLRVSGNIGIHYSGYPGRQVAEDVIRDTYLAARCDYFLGNGTSNVSTTVQHLKYWKDGAYTLIGSNRLYEKYVSFLLQHA